MGLDKLPLLPVSAPEWIYETVLKAGLVCTAEPVASFRKRAEKSIA